MSQRTREETEDGAALLPADPISEVQTEALPNEEEHAFYEENSRQGITHADLVKRAARWLRTTQRCGVVFTEHTATFEHPDAMGWRRGGRESFVVECKVSRSDFHADKRKPSRFSYEMRPALRCYYMTPPNLVTVDDLPEGWGLLYAEPRLVRVIAESRVGPMGIDDRTTEQLRSELERLYCEVRRYQVNGITYPKIGSGTD